MNLVILGPQGSGKTTQGEFLAERLGIPLLDVGDFLRVKAEEKNDLAEEIKKVIDKGDLLDDETLTALLKKELSKETYKDGAVLVGSPRTLAQARLLDGEIKVDRVFYLSVPDDVNYERLLKRKRPDDTPQLIRHRLDLYHKETEPILGYYWMRGVLEKIDGVGNPQEVFARIERKLS